MCIHLIQLYGCDCIFTDALISCERDTVCANVWPQTYYISNKQCLRCRRYGTENRDSTSGVGSVSDLLATPSNKAAKGDNTTVPLPNVTTSEASTPGAACPKTHKGEEEDNSSSKEQASENELSHDVELDYEMGLRDQPGYHSA